MTGNEVDPRTIGQTRFKTQMHYADKEDISELFGKLELAIKKKDAPYDVLVRILVRSEDPSIYERLTPELLNSLVASLHLDRDGIVGKVGEIVASLGKHEKSRELCVANSQLVSTLCKCLQRLHKDEKFILDIKELCRALGNLCYQNEACCNHVMESNGLKLVLEVVRSSLAFKQSEKCDQLRAAATGFLLNLIGSKNDLCKCALEQNICDVLSGVLEKELSTWNQDEVQETAMDHCVNILAVLIDAPTNQPILNERLCRILIDILRKCNSKDISDCCVGLIRSEAEHSSVAMQLARGGLCQLLIQLLEKHKSFADDDDDLVRNLFKGACDIIIVILNDDDSMKFLYADGKGEVYLEMVSWLSHSVDDLKITGVLAMGNFGRCDSHCLEMVKQGVGKKLLKLLVENNTEKSDMKMQHALLSSLRNLVIPSDNKALLVADGLLQVIYTMLSITSFPVLFKLIGTLRMLIDGQEKIAIEMGKKKELVGKVVEWCFKDHPGVQGEACRLLSWIIKFSRDREVMGVMVECEAVAPLVDMTIVPHTIMQLESLLALSLLSAMRMMDAEKHLVQANVGEKLTKLLTDLKPDKEVFINALSLVGHLCTSAALKTHLKQSSLAPAMTAFVKSNAALEEHKTQICRLTTLIDSG